MEHHQMPVSAKVIDFEKYRRARVEPAANNAPHMQFNPTTTGGIAWVPVWFMPVYWVGTPSPQN
jgi:hypothetical protein